MIITQKGLSQQSIDEGRALLIAINRMDANAANYVKRCLSECNDDRDHLRSEWKRRIGFNSETCSALLTIYDAWRTVPDKAIWTAIGLQGVNEIRKLKLEPRNAVLGKIKEGISKKETITPDDVSKLVAKARKPSPRVVKFVANRTEKHAVSTETLESLRRIFKTHPDLAKQLPECARLELGLD